MNNRQYEYHNPHNPKIGDLFECDKGNLYIFIGMTSDGFDVAYGDVDETHLMFNINNQKIETYYSLGYLKKLVSVV